MASFALEHPWALTPAYRAIVANVIARRLAGLEADPADLELAARGRDARPAPPEPRRGPLAILPVYGVLVPRATLFSDVSGVSAVDDLASAVTEAAADRTVDTIVLDVDSPGGNVAGCLEAAAAIREARAVKPVIAVARYTMASAAYWLAAQASEVIASPSARVGSIGVFAIHNDISAALAQLGIARTYVFRGEHKIDGHEAAPLTEEARAELQSTVDRAYEAFTGDVAAGRRVEPARVREGGYGAGRTLPAAEALELGLVDRIATFDATIARLEARTAPPLATVPRLAGAEAVACNATYRALMAAHLGVSL